MACETGSFGPKYEVAHIELVKTTSPSTSIELQALHENPQY